jgi:glycosyltransferase involved in cell wall biosynthesis
MKKIPLVSFLMPVYNCENYIGASIQSILNQTFENFELIIINDGSIDNTERIIKNFNDDRIKYFYQPNSGVAKSLNKGLELAKGDYIRRHDADDISVPNALEKQISFMQSHPEFPLIGNAISFMTENGKIAPKFRNPTKQFFGSNYFIEVNNNNYWEQRPIIHATVLAKKIVFEEAGGYRISFPTAEDIDLWLRILEKHFVAIINEVNYFVRLHRTSNTQVHGIQNEFYRNLAFKFFQERKICGTDPIIRGEKIPTPPSITNKKTPKAQPGRVFRSDILNYKYKIFLNAKDWKLVLQSIKISLKDGWKLKRTWNAILFPLLGDRLVNTGVKIKSITRR